MAERYMEFEKQKDLKSMMYLIRQYDKSRTVEEMLKWCHLMERGLEGNIWLQEQLSQRVARLVECFFTLLFLTMLFRIFRLVPSKQKA